MTQMMTDDDYFGFTECSGNSNPTLSQSLSNTNRYELEVLKFFEDSRKDTAVLNSYPMVKAMFARFHAYLPLLHSGAFVQLCGMITWPHKRNMSDKMFEKLLLLIEN
jgi:hypothetical protein